MAPDGGNVGPDEEAELATRAAWLYYAGSFTQAEISQRLNIAPAKAHRLIARAAREGLVRVFIEGPTAGCIALERVIASRFGLDFCRVVPDLGEAGLPLRALGRATAAYLRGALEAGRHRIIGVGHGRTLAASVADLPRAAYPNLCFVSLLGGLPRRVSANPFDVIHRLAEKTGAEAYLMPVPFYANTAADRAVLLAQRGVAEALSIAATATLFAIGIGEVTEGAFLSASEMVAPDEVAEVRRAGAIAEMLGRYYDTSGKLVDTTLHERVIALDPEVMRGREVLAVAGGSGKVLAIAAALRSHLLSALITDEPTARRLVELDGPSAKTRHKTSKGE